MNTGKSKSYGVTLEPGTIEAYAKEKGISFYEARNRLWPQVEPKDVPGERQRAQANRAIESWIEKFTGGPTAILASHGGRLGYEDLTPTERSRIDKGKEHPAAMGYAHELRHKSGKNMTIMDFHRMLDELGDKSPNTLISMCDKGQRDQRFCDSLKVAAAGFPDKTGRPTGSQRNIFTPIGATSKDGKTTSKGMRLITPDGREYSTNITSVGEAIRNLRAQATKK